jgi:hypothetical protein
LATSTDPAAVRLIFALLWAAVACGASDEAGPKLVLRGGDGQPDAPLPDAGAADADVPLDTDTIPRFATVFYFDLAHVERISRFRSGIGHDYSDSHESCRSMKHYVCPSQCDGPNFPPPGSHDPAWTELELRAPADSTVVRLEAEQSFGTQLVLSPDGYPDVFVKIFHVTPISGLAVGARLRAGQVVGTHASDLTMSDIAVERHLPDGYRLDSFFDVLTDEAFAPFAARGISSRAALQISAEERAAAPLDCDGESFLSEGTLSNWVELD